jgi:Asp-tRNA(Asn)/Glu-tRNA(Gln) amidotransferase A subunit family amidase
MGAGRPTKYDPKYNEQVYKLCLLGATDKEIADFFEVDESTINNWKIDFPQFLESIKEGKYNSDAKVAESLYKRALGYEHKEDDIKMFQGDIIITPTIKHYPPDSTAAIFWLKNRRPKDWRDKQEVDISNTDGTLTQLPPVVLNISEELLNNLNLKAK